MANHDSNHSSKESTILLWTIIPASILLTYLFMTLNHRTEGPGERLSANLDLPKKVEVPAEKPAEAHSDTTHVEGGEAAHADTTHAPAAH